MGNLFKIALRNLKRYKRRTLLTTSLIAVGIIFLLVFVSITGSFKQHMLSQITDSYLGDFQIHRRGFVASIESLPLDMNIQPKDIALIEKVLEETEGVGAYTERIKFGGMFSNFAETTNIRINGIYPDKEFAACPLMASRIVQGKQDVSSLQKGSILVPELLARGFDLKVGDTVVVIATNRDGSVNGKTLLVSGILESATGPGGRDGYIHFEDAMEILRMEKKEVSEIAVHVKDIARLAGVAGNVESKLAGEVNKKGIPKFEVHTWQKLSPFYNIARTIDIMTLFIKLMLIAVVLISILNVMIMAVYERVREIGTIAAIGTLPGKILSLFLVEGLCLGISGAIVGVLLSLGVISILNLTKISLAFGRNRFFLAPTIEPQEVLVASLIVIAVSVLASLQPAYKASRMEPIDALRHV